MADTEKRFDEAMAFVEKEQYDKAVPLLQALAEEGYAPAQFNLGECYMDYDTGMQDLTKSAEWYRKAAEQGHADAQNALGNCYYEGDGVEQSKVEAGKWYRKAAEQGHEDAQSSLDLFYDGDEPMFGDYPNIGASGRD